LIKACFLQAFVLEPCIASVIQGFLLGQLFNEAQISINRFKNEVQIKMNRFINEAITSNSQLSKFQIIQVATIYKRECYKP
jgi:hypothetical protein